MESGCISSRKLSRDRRGRRYELTVPTAGLGIPGVGVVPVDVVQHAVARTSTLSVISQRNTSYDVLDRLVLPWPNLSLTLTMCR
jgi:hypothetical protein